MKPQDHTEAPQDRPVVRRPPKTRSARSSRALVLAGASCLLAGLVAIGVSWSGGRAPRAAQAEQATAAAPATPVLSARRVPAATTAMVPRRAMTAAVDPIAQAAPPQSCISVGDGTETLYVHNGTMALVPASNQKILTASAALDLLGADDTLETTFAAGAEMNDGVVQGDLFMIGGGDPLLTTDAYQARQRNGRFPETDLEAVADRLVAGGLRSITGAVVGDATRYDSQRSLPGWPQRWQSGGTVAPLSALLVNDAWVMDPVTGEGPGGPAADPAQHAAEVFARLLSDRGVAIGAPARSGEAPEGAEVLMTAESPPMPTLLQELLAFSDNTTAELLLKEMGVRSGGPGSTAQGVQAVTGWMDSVGVPTDGWAMVDGSGLSSENRVTCELLAELLRRGGTSGPLADGLGVPGSPGTLEDRFEGPGWSERLRAKTGTLNDVSALSGWLSTTKAQELDFEFVVNTADRRVGAADLALQQELLESLLDQPVAPPLEAAGPLPPGDG